MNLHESCRASILSTFKKTENPVHLLLDRESVKLISVLFSRSELLERFQIVTYQITEEEMGSNSGVTMDCIAFLRPTPSNIIFLENEMSKARRFASYQVHFTNILDSTALDRLARADAHEKISDLTQVYCDHYVIHSSLFVTNPHHRTTPRYSLAYKQRCVQGLTSAMISLRLCPNIVRYSKSSRGALAMAKRAVKAFKMRPKSKASTMKKATLFILDRADDPFTPLMFHWTYEAIIHDLMHLSLKRVEVSSSKEELLLDSFTDTFYDTHRSQSFGVVADSLQKRTQAYRSKHAETVDSSNNKVTSLSHLRDRLERVPELNAIGRNISKHLKILSELNHLVEKRIYFESTRVAQRLAVRGPVSESECFKSLLDLFSTKSSVPREDCVRLLLMFALRYEGSEASLKRLVRAISNGDDSEELEDLIDRMIRRMGSRKRTGDLFSNKTYGAVLGGTFDLFKSLTAGTITQIEPLLRTVLSDGLLKNRLDESEYPTYSQDGDSSSRFKESGVVIVFMIGGGVTYAEARVVDTINRELKKNGDARQIVLGGSNLLSSGDFIDLIRSGGGGGNDTAWLA